MAVVYWSHVNNNENQAFTGVEKGGACEVRKGARCPVGCGLRHGMKALISKCMSSSHSFPVPR